MRKRKKQKGGCSLGNRKQERWLEQWKQKEAGLAGKGETERSRAGWKRGNRKQQCWLEHGKQKAAKLAKKGAELAGKGET